MLNELFLKRQFSEMFLVGIFLNFVSHHGQRFESDASEKHRK